MEIAWMLVILALYGAGMYLWGYRRALAKAMDDLQEMKSNMTKGVAQGEWKYENYTWHCGVCGFHPFKGYIPETPGFNICPNCGAKMGGANQ